jgi:hypothetical protein
MRFGMIVEDPMYDEDGVLMDEDMEWADSDELEYDEDEYAD